MIIRPIISRAVITAIITVVLHGLRRQFDLCFCSHEQTGR
jgi:hypothetical protein